VLSAAFLAAEADRPGAAFVNLPLDIMTGEVQCKPNRLSTFVDLGPAAKTSLTEAARLINSAKSQ
jgi:acetolactate synthase-1/2/3 large subunit